MWIMQLINTITTAHIEVSSECLAFQFLKKLLKWVLINVTWSSYVWRTAS